MKTRINLYLDERLGETFKRYCRSHRLSYSEVMERLIYRYLISPQSKAPESSLTVIQEQIHENAVRAYRNVYDEGRQAIIDTALTDSETDSVDDVSPTIPMPIPYPKEVNHHGTRSPRTNRLSKREIGR